MPKCRSMGWFAPRRVRAGSVRFGLLMACALSVTPWAWATDTDPEASRLYLRNGDILPGTLAGMSVGDARLRWVHPAMPGQTLQLGWPHLDRFDQAPRRSLAKPGGSGMEAEASLENGDVVQGLLHGLESDALVLRSVSAGTLRVRRTAVADLRLSRRGDRLYAGPEPGDVWETTEGSAAPEIGPNAMWMGHNTTAGRLFEELPPALRIAGTLAWEGSPHLWIQLFHSSIARAHGPMVFLRVWVSGSGLTMIAGVHDQRTGMRQSMQAGIPDVAQGGSGEIALEVLVDRAEGLIVIRVNGQLAMDWRDVGPMAFEGGGLLFLQQGPGLLRLSDLVVETWRAGIPLEDAPPSDGEGDRLELANGDVLTGRVVDIIGDRARIDSEHGVLMVPVERIRRVRFYGAVREPFPEGLAVHAFVYPRTRLTLAVDGMEKGYITGRASAVGRVRIPVGQVYRLQFNPEVIRDPEEIR